MFTNLCTFLVLISLFRPHKMLEVRSFHTSTAVETVKNMGLMKIAYMRRGKLLKIPL